jgi:hypothetical protein
MTREEFGKFEVWVKLVREFGYPTVALTLFGLAAWVGFWRIHDSAIVPVVSTTVEYIKQSGEVQKQQADAIETLAEAKADQTHILHGINETQKEIVEVQAEIKDTLNRIGPSIGAPPSRD